ncbi:hypothetical protein PQ460_13725 [Paenibacillus sp. KACC 21273]|uniref:hypothetical protein n=1 Tax=Paenibacillus sp. KACC 21273 TaxID=3025665 RepID=UPI002365C8A9|nr:hypothetical protein [Paenibacillus sp. KACC 21273]WDF49071.1 hypothetical protein PQ460_13725 [Paenibacillus sp. KACC 21273]
MRSSLILLVIGCITILNLIYNFQYGKKLKIYSKSDLKDITFGKHGVVTLYNSLKNLNAYNSIVVIIYGCIIVNVKFEWSYSSLRVGILILMFCILSLFWFASSTYRFSEIKHIVDGISTNNQSYKFFSRTFFSGIFNMLAIIFLLILLELHLIFFMIFSVFTIIMFLAGMADVLQSKTINYYGKTFNIKKQLKNN